MSARHCPVSSNAAVCLLYPLLKFVTVFCGGRDAVPLDDVETVLRQAFNNSKLYGYSPLLHGAFEEEPVYDDSNWEQDLSSRKRAAHDVRRGEVWKGEMGKRELGKGEREVGNVEAFNPRVLKTRALKPRLSRVEFHLPERNDSFADADPEDPSPDDPSPDDPSLDVCEDWSRPLVFVEDMLTPTPARRHLQRVWSDRRPARRHGMALGRKWGRQRRWDWWRRLWRNKSHRAHWIADDVLAFWRQCKRKGYTNDKQLRDAALATTGNRGTGSFMMSVKDIDGLVIVDENGRKARYLEFLDPGYSSLETGYSSLETGYSSPETADRKSLGRRTSSSRGLKPYFLRRFSGKPLAAQVVTDGATRRRLDSWVSPAPEQGSRQENYQGRQLLRTFGGPAFPDPTHLPGPGQPVDMNFAHDGTGGIRDQSTSTSRAVLRTHPRRHDAELVKIDVIQSLPKGSPAEVPSLDSPQDRLVIHFRRRPSKKRSTLGRLRSFFCSG